MKAFVIFDSAFGNTAQVAQAIGSALGEYAEAAVHKVENVGPELWIGVDLLVVGSPTQGFRPTAATVTWLKEIAQRGLDGVQVAAFDTRVSLNDIKSPFFRSLIDIGGYAAKRIAKRLEKAGGTLVIAPEGFIVEGKEGPLKAGELDRARDWAKRIAAALVSTPLVSESKDAKVMA